MQVSAQKKPFTPIQTVFNPFLKFVAKVVSDEKQKRPYPIKRINISILDEGLGSIMLLSEVKLESMFGVSENVYKTLNRRKMKEAEKYSSFRKIQSGPYSED